MEPLDLSRELFVEHVFVEQSTPDEVLKTTSDVKHILGLVCPEEDLPISAIPPLLDADEDEAKSKGEQLAKSVMRNEPVRAAKRRLCAAMSSELRERVTQGSVLEAAAWTKTHTCPVEEANYDAKNIRGWRLIPLGLFLAFSLALVVWALFITEPVNALTLFELSGFLEDHSLIAKISFAITPAVLIFATFLVAPLVFRPQTSDRIDKIVLGIFFPIGIVTAFLLAKSMGEGMDPDPFNPEPVSQWLVIFLIGISSAGVAVLGKIATRHSAKMLYGYRESRKFEFHSGRAARWTRFVRHSEGLLIQLEAIVSQLDQEEEAFATRFLSEVECARHYMSNIACLAIENAKRDAKPVPSCLRPTLDHLEVQPRTFVDRATGVYKPSKNGKPQLK